jgi:hypothetical protein
VDGGERQTPKPNNQSVVFSDLAALETALVGGDASLKPLASRLAREIQQSVRTHLAGRQDYIILDRADERIADHELNRTVGANTAAFEREKLGRERAADLALVFDFGPLEAHVVRQQFKFADSLNQVVVAAAGRLKLIEVATKAELAHAIFPLGPATATSVGDAGTAALQAESDLFKSAKLSAVVAMSEIYWALDKSFGNVSPAGVLEFENPLVSAFAESVGSVHLAPIDKSTGAKLNGGKEYVVKYVGGELKLGSPAHLVGERVAVKITSLRSAAHQSTLPSQKESSEKANRILDKFK